MNRKKFFTSISLGVIGLALFNNFPISAISKMIGGNKKEIKVKSNPLAVSRTKIGEKNV